MLYSADVTGLGNIRRTLAIAWKLSELRPDAALLAVTGSLVTDAFSLPPEFDFVKVPNASQIKLYRELPKAPGAHRLPFFDLRSRLITETAAGFRPHLALIDTFPSGIEREALEAIRLLHQATPRPRIVLGLRDVIETGHLARAWWERLEAYDLIDNVFDDILIYGSPDVYNHIEELGFSDRAAAKVTFCGYIRQREELAPVEEIRAKYGASDRPFVVVAIGGGEFGHYLLSAYLEAVKAGMLPDVVSCLVTGPMMRADTRAKLAAASADVQDVHFVEFAGEPLSLYNAADVLVTMGGITMVEAVGLGKQVVSAPLKDKNDQYERSLRFGRLGLVIPVPPDEFSAERLAKAVQTGLMSSPAPNNLSFDGLEVAGPLLASALP